MSTFKTISKIQCRQKRMQKNRHGVLLQFNSVQNSRTYWGRTHSAGPRTCCAGRWLPPGEEGGVMWQQQGPEGLRLYLKCLSS